MQQQQNLTDQELVQQYLSGREQAFAELLRRHKTRVYTAIYMFVRDKYIAEDLFQETFIKAVKKLNSGLYNDEGKFLPWLLRIANNLCIDYYRKTKRSPKVTNPDGYDIFSVLPFHETGAQEAIIKSEDQRTVRALIDQLPPDQKEVLILRHYADYSFKEIAELTGVSINTALGRMRYAIMNMRRLFMEQQVNNAKVGIN
ncbi:MAG: sigma-70 family RNA polymerase sigma factor [Bacteroidetes bacterium]|nr:sigma-70 family RNA polymerase sigma factor [Bacteroidota bacterium]GDX47967.1 RNA polymerase subunit sigma-24 [Bacteroidota bacterium]